MLHERLICNFYRFPKKKPVAADTIGMSFMGVYFFEKGATSQLLSVYLIIAQFFPATVVFS